MISVKKGISSTLINGSKSGIAGSCEKAFGLPFDEVK